MLNKILPTFFAGTAIKITSVLNIDTPTSALVSVRNPSTLPVVASEQMNKDDNGVYSYILQSYESWCEGDYTVTIKVMSGIYTSVTQAKFTIVRQE